MKDPSGAQVSRDADRMTKADHECGDEQELDRQDRNRSAREIPRRCHACSGERDGGHRDGDSGRNANREAILNAAGDDAHREEQSRANERTSCDEPQDECIRNGAEDDRKH
jgi:hypothetical protein